MKLLIVVIAILIIGFGLGVFAESKRHGEVEKFKVQAVDRGYAEVTVINNKLEWHWKEESIWQEPETINYRNDEGEDIEIKSR